MNFGYILDKLDFSYPVQLHHCESESYESLVEDATILLEGSKGRVGLVIIIKIFPLKPRETTLQKGFVEVWYLGPLTSKAGRIEWYDSLHYLLANHFRSRYGHVTYNLDSSIHPALSWYELQGPLERVRFDVSLILDCCHGGRLSHEGANAMMEVLAGRKGRQGFQGSGPAIGSPFT